MYSLCQACGKGGEGGMSKECGPFGDEVSTDCSVQALKTLASSCFGELAGEHLSFFAPMTSIQRYKRPSGSALDGQVLGTSVPWTFAHSGAPCLHIVLCVVGLINQSIKPACPWAAHLGAGDRRKPTSYIQHCTNTKSHLRLTM